MRQVSGTTGYIRLDGVHARTSRVAVVGGLACRTRWRSGLSCGSEDLHRGIRVRRVTALRILSVQEQLGAEITSRRRIGGAPGVSDEAALFAQNSALLDALEADPADNRWFYIQ